MEKFATNTPEETHKVAAKLARKILGGNPHKSAVVLGLMGELGAGKTTFLQGFARALGVKEVVNSPTFLIMKKFGNFYHIDCYRLEKPEELLELGFEKIMAEPKNIVAIEWPERIEGLLPKHTIKIHFKHLAEHKREIVVE